MKTGIPVADAMTTKPVSVAPGVSVRDASVVMRDHDVGSLLVVAEKSLLGIVTAEDIVSRVTARDVDPAATPIAAVMTTDIVDIRPGADIFEAVVAMREHDVFHLPVRDDAGVLLGLLTLKDVLRIEPQLFELMAEMAEIRLPRRTNPDLGSVRRREGQCAECGSLAQDLQRVGGRLLCGYCLAPPPLR